MNEDMKLEIIGSKAFLLKRNKKLLKWEKKLIGELRRSGDLINLFKIEKEKDRFKKTDSWGINYELFQLITGTINIKTEIGIYRIGKREAQIWHRVMHFKEQGYETQCFVPVSRFTFTKIETIND